MLGRPDRNRSFPAFGRPGSQNRAPESFEVSGAEAFGARFRALLATAVPCRIVTFRACRSTRGRCTRRKNSRPGGLVARSGRLGVDRLSKGSTVGGGRDAELAVEVAAQAGGCAHTSEISDAIEAYVA